MEITAACPPPHRWETKPARLWEMQVTIKDAWGGIPSEGLCWALRPGLEGCLGFG